MNINKLFYLLIVLLHLSIIICCAPGKDFTANKIAYKPNTIGDEANIGILSVSTEAPYVYSANSSDWLVSPITKPNTSFAKRVKHINMKLLISNYLISDTKMQKEKGKYHLINIDKDFDIDIRAIAEKENIDYIMLVDSCMYRKDYYDPPGSMSRKEKLKLKVRFELIDKDNIKVLAEGFVLSCDRTNKLKSEFEITSCYDNLAQKSASIIAEKCQGL